MMPDAAPYPEEGAEEDQMFQDLMQSMQAGGPSPQMSGGQGTPVTQA